MDEGRRGMISKKLADMGIYSGSIIDIEGLEPLNNNIDIKVRGYHLSLSEQDAGKITVELHG